MRITKSEIKALREQIQVLTKCAVTKQNRQAQSEAYRLSNKILDRIEKQSQ